MQNFVAIHMAIFRYFQNGERPQFWICCEHVWTIHKEYMVVFITLYKISLGSMQYNFDNIINMQVLILNEFGLKMHIKCTFTPQQ